MKSFIISIIFFVAVAVWLNNWITSGKMDRYIKDNPHPIYTPIILKLLTQACYDLNSPAAAIHYGQWLTQDYPGSPALPQTLYHLGLAYESLNKKDLALSQYQVLVGSFSRSEYGDIAQQRLKKLTY